MSVFESCVVVLEVRHLPFKEKKKLMSAVTDNGGKLSYVLNKQCTHLITTGTDAVSPHRWYSIQKLGVPVVRAEYLSSCLTEGVLLPLYEFIIQPPAVLEGEKVKNQQPVRKLSDGTNALPQTNSSMSSGSYLGKFRLYTHSDADVPEFPADFEVAKYEIFQKENPCSWAVLELQSCVGEGERKYRVLKRWCDDQEFKASISSSQVHCSTSEEALEVYALMHKDFLSKTFSVRTALPSEAECLSSSQLHKLLLHRKLGSCTISQEEAVFVELLWTEALGCLGDILTVPVTSISLNDVSRAEGLLLNMQKESAEDRRSALTKEFCTLLPHKEIFTPTIKNIAQKLDLCQLIRDMLNVGEVNLWSPAPSSLGKYRALNCSIERVPPDSQEFRNVSAMMHGRSVQIQQMFSVRRPAELQLFQKDLGNVQALLHSTSPSSFVGILSRGLLLPRVGVEHYGIERTDIGYLGSGIYFSDSICTSLKYSKLSRTDGTHFLLVCDVALGQCYELRNKDVTLTCAPEGCHSVHGVRHNSQRPSDFQDDEYVVYSTHQVQLKYVVQFTLDGSQVKAFQPHVSISEALAPTAVAGDVFAEGEGDALDKCKNPLDEMTAGLQDSTGQRIPLKAVNVKCKLMDLLSQVIIFQTYHNQSLVPIEAKFVFPLDECATVCGFEAFINGKHVVGQVKEKEQARREYRQAIEKGHGAYLMDQEAPDVFSISVGNLPPQATVLIKVTYMTELLIREGCVEFSLPCCVAPWQQSQALNQQTQGCVEKVCVTDSLSDQSFSLDMSIEMPSEIQAVTCRTHRIKLKKTQCKAVLSTETGQPFGPDGFQLSISMSNIYLPRMWVENHTDKQSQACMLVFYPDLELNREVMCSDGEVVILLDTSESMRGAALQDARRIATQVLKVLDGKVKINVVFFGSDYTELFMSCQRCDSAREKARRHVLTSAPVGGSTELWKPLHMLSLLPPCRGTRNLLLISDGHIHSQAMTLPLVKDNCRHSRLFTCGVSPTANRHMLRALAQAGGGTYEFFDTKAKHTWAEKVACLVKHMACLSFSSVSVKWQQFSSSAPQPVQAPSQLHALFSGCHTLVFGFVAHCTQASLLGEASGRKVETMVSTSELQKTRGTFLHKLTARALIRDYEDGNLHIDHVEHEGRRTELKSYIIELSKEYSIISQYTSFVAIEERGAEEAELGITDVAKLIAEEDVDFLSYMGWDEEQPKQGTTDVADLFVEEAVDCFGICEWNEEESEESFSAFFDCIAEEHAGEYMSSVLIGYDDACEYKAEKNGETMVAQSKKEMVLPDLVAAGAVGSGPCSPSSSSDARPAFNSAVSRIGSYRNRVPIIPCGSFTPTTRDLYSGAPPPPPGQPDAPPPPSALFKGPFVFLPPPQQTLAFGSSSSSRRFSPKAAAKVGRVTAGAPPPPPSKPGAPPSGPFTLPFQSCPPRPQAGLFGASSSFPGFSPQAAAQTGPVTAGVPPPPCQPGAPLPPPCQPGAPLPPPCHPGAPLPPPGQPDALLPPPGQPDALLPPPGQPDAPPPPSALFKGPFVFLPPPQQTLAFGSSSRRFSPQAAAKVGPVTAGAPPSQPSAPPPPSGPFTLPFQSCPPHPQAGIFGASSSFAGFSLQAAAQTGPVTAGVPPPPPSQSGAFAEATRDVSTHVIPPIPSNVLGPDVRDMPTSVIAYQGPAFIPAAKAVAPCAYERKSLRCRMFPTYQNAQIDQPEELMSPLQDQPRDTPSKHSNVFSHMSLDDAQGVSIKMRQETLCPMGTIKRKKRLSRMSSDIGRSDDIQWDELFAMQQQGGYWECTPSLGVVLKLDLDYFATVFLKEKGIQSLGLRAQVSIVRLLATLLVLQLMRLRDLAEGKLLKSLLRLEEPHTRSPRWPLVKRAVEWARQADRRYPCICSRMEFGRDWESVTRQLLGAEPLQKRSPLTSVLHRAS